MKGTGKKRSWIYQVIQRSMSYSQTVDIFRAFSISVVLRAFPFHWSFDEESVKEDRGG